MFRNCLRSVAPLLGAVLTAACLAGSAHAYDITINNYSNESIWVCQAHRHAYGTSVSEGWSEIKPNESQEFSATDEQDLYLRVESPSRGELHFAEHDTYTNFPTRRDCERFEVEAKPDDHNVRTFAWGDDLEQSVNRTRQEGLPDGWELRRFFRASGGKSKLEVRP